MIYRYRLGSFVFVRSPYKRKSNFCVFCQWQRHDEVRVDFRWGPYKPFLTLGCTVLVLGKNYTKHHSIYMDFSSCWICFLSSLFSTQKIRWYHSYIWICKGPWTANIWRLLLTCTDDKRRFLHNGQSIFMKYVIVKLLDVFKQWEEKQLSLHFDIIQYNQDNGMHNTHLNTRLHTHMSNKAGQHYILTRKKWCKDTWWNFEMFAWWLHAFITKPFY